MFAEAPDAPDLVQGLLERAGDGLFHTAPYPVKLAHVYYLHHRGATTEAGKILGRILAENRRALTDGADWPAVFMQNAAVYALEGQPATALDELDLTYAAGWRDGRALAIDPFFATLRSAPRFIQPLSRIASDVAAHAYAGRLLRVAAGPVRQRFEGRRRMIATLMDGSYEEDIVADVNILEVAKQYLSRLSDGAGPEELDSFFAPDVVFEEFPNRLRPTGATGDLQAMKEARTRGRALLKAERFELVNAVAGDSKIAMEVIWTGTVRDAAGPFAAGQALRARFALFMEFREGRIVRQRNYDCFDPW